LWRPRGDGNTGALTVTTHLGYDKFVLLFLIITKAQPVTVAERSKT
jgi:hypothetical protein